ncbi:MAG: hypothetical protein IVW57_07480 [Ktedonobacterales bacterium]|nr:hypothetical protein [Ktedonobacterales bacterium]
MLSRIPRIPPYTGLMGLLVLGITIYALTQGDPLGYILATGLVVFLGLPALVIWRLSARDQRASASRPPTPPPGDEHEPLP